MQRTLLWTESLTDNAKCWKTEQRFDTMGIHEHGFLLLALCSSRILRGIRCLSITGSQPLPIGLRRWPQTWRRAKKWTPAITLPQIRQGIAMILHEAFPCGTKLHMLKECQKRLQRNELARFYHWKQHNRL